MDRIICRIGRSNRRSSTGRIRFCGTDTRDEIIRQVIATRLPFNIICAKALKSSAVEASSGAAILKLGFRHVERHAFHIKRSEDALAQEFAERRARYLHVQHLPQARRRKTGPSVGERLQKAYEKVMAGTRTR